MQNHFQKGFVHTNSTVVFKKTELAKSVHEKTDTRSRGANHFRQCLLRNFWNQCFRLPRFAEFGHQQKNSG